MSDRIAIFNHGRIEQVGTPAEVYERPANEFVADFVGTSNVIERSGRRFTVRPEKIRMLDEGRTLVALRQNLDTSAGQALEERGRRVRLAWHPDHAFAVDPAPGDATSVDEEERT